MSRPRPLYFIVRPSRYAKYKNAIGKVSQTYLKTIVARMEALVEATPGVRIFTEAEDRAFPTPEEVLKRWKRVKKRIKVKNPKRWEPGRIPDFDYYQDRMVTKSMVQNYINEMTDLETGMYRQLAADVAVTAGIAPVVNQAAIKAIERKVFRITTTSITPTITNQLRSVLDSSIKAGMTIEETAHRIGMLNTNWRTIANTETMDVANLGAFDQAVQEQREYGGETFKGWQLSGNPNHRESHIEAGARYGRGNEIPIEEAFMVGGVPMMHPHDPKAPPDEVINCGCISYYVVR